MNAMYIDVKIDNHDLAQLVAAAALAEGHEGGLLGEGPRPGQHKLLVVLGLDTGDALPARSQPSYFYTDNTSASKSSIRRFGYYRFHI